MIDTATFSIGFALSHLEDTSSTNTSMGAANWPARCGEAARISCYGASVYDQRRLAWLFDSYSALVYRRARRLLGNQADAEEVLQDIFVRVMSQDLETETEGDLVGWFYRVTTNLCLNRIRNARRRRELFREHIAPEAGREPEAEGDADAELTIRWLLANADERQALCAAYAYLDEMKYEEIAEVMGVSKRTVSNLMDRFKDWARRELERASTPVEAVSEVR